MPKRKRPRDVNQLAKFLAARIKGVMMLHATRIALIQTLQARLTDEQAMLTKLRDRYIELDIEHFAAELEAREE